MNWKSNWMMQDLLSIRMVRLLVIAAIFVVFIITQRTVHNVETSIVFVWMIIKSVETVYLACAGIVNKQKNLSFVIDVDIYHIVQNVNFRVHVNLWPNDH